LLRTPLDDPSGWADAAAPGIDAVIAMAPHAIAMAPRAIANGGAARAEIVEGIDRLVAAGARPLGHVSLAFATRPLAAILDEISHWAVLPVIGVFFDHAPAGPYHLGPVVRAVRTARRYGLDPVVLNPGVPVDPTYRGIEATICTFEGTWTEYTAWSADEEFAPGDGHLVFDVPRAQWQAARALSASRRAGLVRVTDGPAPDVPVPASTFTSVPRQAAPNPAWARRRPAITDRKVQRTNAVRQRLPRAVETTRSGRQ
jgi:hypothetical protein